MIRLNQVSRLGELFGMQNDPAMLGMTIRTLGLQSQAPNSAVSEAFYSGALQRISRTMLLLGVVSSVAAWLRFGWHIAVGFACGCAIAYLNFHWLKRVVSALA